MPDIHHELLINASAETVYKALVTQEGLSAWWTPQTEAEPEINSIARFTFGSGYFKEMRIINLAPNNQVEWIALQVPKSGLEQRYPFNWKVQTGRPCSAPTRSLPTRYNNRMVVMELF